MTGIGYRFATLAGAVALALTLGGCLPGFEKSGAGGAGVEKTATTVITGDAIETTALGPPGAAVGAPGAKTAPAAAAVATSGNAPAEAAAAAAPAPPETVPPEVAPPEAAPVETNPFTAEARLTCEKAGGNWAKTGSGFNSCVWSTKDSGKRCTASTQCEGQCLARSGTCAPFTPLFGCSEILDDSGRRMTECLQ
ncbi:hypothetical protein [Rhodobacter sp. 24-YEA-8]|uniref:hypothetical protein n=1 Tax=Rhodobacter sp. 24-YEA-8 TaxID=1884310 RepID=UPI00089A4BBC|nr:hypothetical protein [Rhodobacter sp. 24-YEA-8]SEC02630.1 hypothetical protein SAMN05519105_1795 [Rhodobacter sp. 24-YEA-8]